MNDKTIQYDILGFLRYEYGKNEPVSRDDIIGSLEYEEHDTLVNLRYLETKKWIYCIPNHVDPYYEITADGIDAIIILEPQIKDEPESKNVVKEETLDFEVENDDFKGLCRCSLATSL